MGYYEQQKRNLPNNLGPSFTNKLLLDNNFENLRSVQEHIMKELVYAFLLTCIEQETISVLTYSTQ